MNINISGIDTLEVLEHKRSVRETQGIAVAFIEYFEMCQSAQYLLSPDIDLQSDSSLLA
jgi:hypothetical protein